MKRLLYFTLSFSGLLVFSLFSCTHANKQAVDGLNDLSYAYHYRNLDSTYSYAQRAFLLSQGYRDGKAEALNNLAFVSLLRMDYDKAKHQLDSVSMLTDNQIEVLISDVMQMRLCQRRSHNREFYDYRADAEKTLRRINEERLSLTPRQTARLIFAESELAIVTSAYYYYVGLEQQSVDALLAIDTDVERDTAQWMNFLYNIGAGGIILEGTKEQIEQKEMECLLQCYWLSQQFGSSFFMANSLEAIADHLLDAESCERLLKLNPTAFRQLNADEVEATQLPVYLANEALGLFEQFGDTYQIAGAYRTVASCYWAQGDNASALYYLERALADSVINQAPDLVASIREQLSVVYSAIDDKPRSDLNRNLYLDLQEQTRQDRSLEARAGQLDATVSQINKLLAAVAVTLVLLIVALRLLYVYHHYQKKRQVKLDELQDLRDEVEEQLAIAQLKKKENERRNLEQRAKISLVNGITPLIDRMLHEVHRMEKYPERKDDCLQYIKELTQQINEQNNVLTHWIQLRQGELSLHIETFAMQELFDIIAKGRRSFMLKGITLNVLPTSSRVKADKVLTLFMLNTLADNARKFTSKEGTVTVSADEHPGYVEISVTDTGQGMDEKELASVFDHKVAGGHGFGLQNCRGIIEKYRKISQIFSVCKLGAESTKGQGSRFFFRLPKGVVRLLLLIMMGTTSAMAQDVFLQKASNYADSAYYSNINGTYNRTLLFADSCFHHLNLYYREQYPEATDTLKLFDVTPPASSEIGWLHKNVALNYNILLSIRNESAIAALALHEWQLYQYNNRIYTLLFKELSADNTLEEYCRKMQQSQTDRTVAVILLIMMVLGLITVIIIQMVQAVGRKAARQQERQMSIELLKDEVRVLELEMARLHISNQVLENCLSALKHETMYYPSRIQQLVDTGNTDALSEVVGYYRELYGILSEQAGRQIEGITLHLTQLDHEIFGDANMIDYLLEILKKQARQKKLMVDYEGNDENYIVCKVQMPDVPATDFMPAIPNISYLLCRQIVREHGEATGRRGCGIYSEKTDYGSLITIKLPRYICKTLK